MKYFRLLRVRHYMKNFLIVLPLFFSGKMMQKEAVISTIIGVVCFCFVSSAIYILNDLHDAPMDREHPTKCKRPIASGEVSTKAAICVCIACLAVALLLAFLDHMPWTGYAYAGIYIVCNVIYSFKGKEIPVLDILLLGAGYPIRVLFGGAVIATGVSIWLFLTVLCVSLYFALGKRRGEYQRNVTLYGEEGAREHFAKTRPVLSSYNLPFLDSNIHVCLGLSIVFYALWALEKSEIMAYTVVPVLIICLKYDHILYTGADGDPVETLLASKLLVVLVLLYVAMMAVIMYMGL